MTVPVSDPPEPYPDDPSELPPDAEEPPHDPMGLDVASDVARNLAGILPAPRGIRRPRRRRRAPDLPEQRSGAGPDRRDPQLVGLAFSRLVEGRGWQTQLGVRQLLNSWPALVGSTIADHTHPETFSNGVLCVQADSTAWATALRRLAPQLVARLNAELGDGSVVRVDVRGPKGPSWSHGRLSVRDGRGPRDTYG